jgi:hypothetical protein
MSAQTGADADPLPGVVFYYSTDDEDGYAIRYVVLKVGDSVTFRTPWLISPGDEVFALAFFLDAWPDSENHGSYTLTFQRHDESAREATIPLTGGGKLRLLEALDRLIGQPQQGQPGQPQQGKAGQPQQGLGSDVGFRLSRAKGKGSTED